MRTAALLLLATALGATGSLAAATAATERTGEQIVKAQCSACHESGRYGAPRIDDRAAWVARMKNGLDAAVRSAMKGHGKMPARGGLADLSDNELRSAVVYMFNPAAASPKPAPAPVPAAPANQKKVDGTEIYLGVIPVGEGLYHVNVTLRDAQTQATIGDAQVEVKVSNIVMGPETKKLDRVTINNVVGYGSDFHMSGKEPHVITVQIRRPQSARPIEARFDFKG
jgi:cytochrome c5